MRHDPPPVAATRLGVFTTREARAAGWPPDVLERAARRGEQVRRLREGVYATVGRDADLPAPQVRRLDEARHAIAAGLTVRGAVVSHLVVSTLQGWPVWAPRERSCLSVADTSRTRVPGVHLHRTALPPESVATVAGIRITRPARTVVDIACEFGTEAGLVAADAALGTRLTTRDHLRAEVEARAGLRGVASARSLPDLADPRSESPLESRSRWQCVVHHLPTPRPQAVLRALDGTFLGRVDLYWEAGVVGEVDGAGKLLDPAARRALLRRQTLLFRAGLRVVRWGPDDLDTFGTTADWIRRELADASLDPRPRGWVVAPG